jgi:N6-L-threonylcarbamoyladenine synthase
MPITVHRVILFILFPSFLSIIDKSRTKILKKVIHTTFITTFAESFKKNNMSIIILGIESSCDDTSAAIIKDGYLLSNVTASQAVHMAYGGVVPELASRAHQQNIVPVVDQALKQAGVKKEELSAVAFTRGPGLMGSLLVGVSFAKGFARSLGIPMIDVNHLTGHVLANFIKVDGEANEVPDYPFLCLLVSGGNSQIILVKAYNDMEILGQTIDDAAGEAIDKCSKVMGLGYPGGPIIDKLARQGNPKAFTFNKPHIPGLDYSFSGLKTSFLYSLKKWVEEDPDFVEHHKADLAASLEATIVDILMDKLRKAAKQYKIKEVALAGGVSANTGLREAFRDHARRYGWKIFIPKFSYTTDNAAMIAITGYYKYQDKDFCPIEAPAYSRVSIK